MRASILRIVMTEQLPCGHTAETILTPDKWTLTMNAIPQEEFWQLLKTVKLEGEYEHVEYRGLTVKDHRFVCVECGADISKVPELVQTEQESPFIGRQA